MRSKVFTNGLQNSCTWNGYPQALQKDSGQTTPSKS